jgi:hypothetical protein
MAQCRYRTNKDYGHPTLNSLPSLFDAAVRMEERVAYFDVVRIWFSMFLPPSIISILRGLCGGEVNEVPGVMRFYDEEGQIHYRRPWIYKLELHQPRPEAFAYLDRCGFLPEEYFINYIEFALDLTTETRADKEIVYEFIAAHLVQRWRGRRSVFAFRSGFYNGRRQRGGWNFPVSYTEKPSKITGEPCCHIEWRCQGAKNIKRLGIHTFADMANFSHRTFWKRRLLLKAIVSLEELGKTFMRHRRKRKPLWTCYEGVRPFNAYLRAGDCIISGFGMIWISDQHGDKAESRFSLQHLLDRTKGWGLQKCLRIIPNGAFLPA